MSRAVTFMKKQCSHYCTQSISLPHKYDTASKKNHCIPNVCLCQGETKDGWHRHLCIQDYQQRRPVKVLDLRFGHPLFSLPHSLSVQVYLPGSYLPPPPPHVILFLSYVNDLPDLVLGVSLYTGDPGQMCSSKSSTDVVSILQSAVNRVVLYSGYHI